MGDLLEPEYISNNQLVLKKQIKKVKANKILFDDNSLEKIDVIVCCTGHKEDTQQQKCFSFLKLFSAHEKNKNHKKIIKFCLHKKYIQFY